MQLQSKGDMIDLVNGLCLIQDKVKAEHNNIQGNVIVQFIEKKDGSVGDVKESIGVDKYLDQEAIRLVKSLPKFSPGRNTVGNPVDVWYTLPVIFRLQGVN